MKPRVKMNVGKWAYGWALVVFALLVHQAYLWGGQRVTPDTDILALLPVQERDPILQQSFSHMVDAAQQRIVVLVGAEHWQDSKSAADAYTAELARHKDLFDINSLSEKSQNDWLASFQKNRTGLLSREHQVQLKNFSTQDWTDRALGRLYSAFSGPKLGSFQDDPFGTFEAWVQERAQETPVRPREGYLFVADERRQYVLIAINLIPPAFSLTAQEKIMPALAQAALAANKTSGQLEILVSGVVLHAAAAGQQASQEVSTIGLGSLLGIVVLMWLSFYSFKPVGLILLSIGVGFLGALSVCFFLFDRIHLMTLVFGASLIGVAQDYGIYFLCHRLGANQLSSKDLLKHLMPGLLLTLLTTVVGYLGLALTPFPGLRQMAVFSGVGLLFAWLTVVFWFPPLAQTDSLKAGGLAVQYGRVLALFSYRPTTPVLALIAVSVVGLSVYGLSKLGINDDIRLLQTPPKHLVQDQLKLGKLLDAPTPVQYFLVRGDTAELVLQREEQLKLSLDPLIDQRVISGYQAISNWVPSLKTQRENRRLIETQLLAEGGTLSQVASRIDAEAAWPVDIRQNLGASNHDMTVEAFFQSAASQASRHLWLGEIERQYASIVAIKGMKYAQIGQLSQLAGTIDGVQWVDKIAEISSVLGRYRENMGWVLLAAYLLVFACMYVRYREHTWRTLLPTALASLLTLALLGLMGHSLQLFHVLALMLLLGIGVDYGIFMQEQCHNHHPHDIHPHEHGRSRQLAWLATGLSAASTILSFGLLALSATPALRAFGLTLLMGTALVWLIVPFFAQVQKSSEITLNKDE